jgi:putative dehydrogenase
VVQEFIGEDFPEALIYKGAAGLYERVAADVAGDRASCERIDAFLAS